MTDTLSSSTSTLSSSTLNAQNEVVTALSSSLLSSLTKQNELLTTLSETTVSSLLLTTSLSTLSAQEKEVLTALSKTIGSLPPLPPSLDSLDAFSGQLLPPPSSTVPSQAKRPYDDKKSNPFVDLEAEEDIWDDADILDVEADDDFGAHPPLQNTTLSMTVKCLQMKKESDGADASKLCSNVSDVYPRHIHPVVDDLKQYLYELLVVPKEGDWVRLNSPPLYRGDLAYVHAYNDTSPDCLMTKLKNPGGKGADVLVVPRVEQFLNRTKGKGRAGRPPQQLLELKQAIQLFGAGAVNANDELNFTYLRQRYGDGLHYTVTHEFEPTVPTHKEFALFQRCSFVEPGDIARGINKIAALSLQVTDRIVVTSGELVGMSGIITEFSGNDQEATIRLDSTEIAMDVVISPILLRKVV
ncbi:hypothetical protein DXG01_005825 [Tephrocybe rancida]|nr:hypothetical protein DXG01_005825 [Tephrocybe rancida]